MSTIGWTNLNDAPTDPRPLTAAELDRYRRLHRVHVPDPAPAPRIPRQRVHVPDPAPAPRIPRQRVHVPDPAPAPRIPRQRVHVPDPAPAPRIPRQREVSIPGLLLLAALAACAAGFGWLAMAALF